VKKREISKRGGGGERGPPSWRRGGRGRFLLPMEEGVLKGSADRKRGEKKRTSLSTSIGREEGKHLHLLQKGKEEGGKREKRKKRISSSRRGKKGGGKTSSSFAGGGNSGGRTIGKRKNQLISWKREKKKGVLSQKGKKIIKPS